MEIKFSVVIPYYKKREYIERCIESVKSQTFKGFEIIVVDDGSQDDLINLINEKFLNDVRLIQQPNQGVSSARNTGIKNANFEYIAFLDADDCWSSIYLDSMYRVISQNKEVTIIGSRYSRDLSKLEENVLEPQYVLFADYFKKQAIINTLFFSSSTIINKKFFVENPGFNSDLKRGEDIDVWLRAAISGGKVIYIENTLVFYSDEDKNQATRINFSVEKTLVGVINNLYQPLTKNNKNVYFDRFISLYVYFNLYPYYFSTENYRESKKILSQNQYYFFFLHIPYWIPLSWGIRINNNKFYKRMLRLYLKFFIRKFYI